MFLVHFVLHVLVWLALGALALCLELGDVANEAAASNPSSVQAALRRFQAEANDFISGKNGFWVIALGAIALVLWFVGRGVIGGWKTVFKGISFRLPPKGTSWL
jgi:hypothetical protein